MSHQLALNYDFSYSEYLNFTESSSVDCHLNFYCMWRLEYHNLIFDSVWIIKINMSTSSVCESNRTVNFVSLFQSENSQSILLRLVTAYRAFLAFHVWKAIMLLFSILFCSVHVGVSQQVTMKFKLPTTDGPTACHKIHCKPKTTLYNFKVEHFNAVLCWKLAH